MAVFNMLTPEQNKRFFADKIIICVCLDKYDNILLQISSKCISSGLFGNTTEFLI